MNHPRNNPAHDRLDRKVHTLDFTGPLCGSVNARTGLPEYCDFECPTLHGKQEHPEPHPLFAALAAQAKLNIPPPEE